jgi:hypothetical protein
MFNSSSDDIGGNNQVIKFLDFSLYLLLLRKYGTRIVAWYLPSICKTLGSIPSTTGRKEGRKKKYGLEGVAQ